MFRYRILPILRSISASRTDSIIDSLLNLFYPEVCFICAAPISRRKDRGICPKCLEKAAASRIRSPICPSCGLPMPNFQPGANFLCGKCILQPPPFSGARAYGYYSAELGKLIQGLKFHKRRNLAELLNRFLVEAYYEAWDRNAFDLAVPMPLHPKRRRDRGYNQAELLGRSLALRIGIHFSSRVLIRYRRTLPQVGLTDSERLANVRNAFRCVDTRMVSGRRILLIDDVMTTGSTAASAARTLVKSGATRVSVLTLARTE